MQRLDHDAHVDENETFWQEALNIVKTKIKNEIYDRFKKLLCHHVARRSREILARADDLKQESTTEERDDAA